MVLWEGIVRELPEVGQLVENDSHRHALICNSRSNSQRGRPSSTVICTQHQPTKVNRAPVDGAPDTAHEEYLSCNPTRRIGVGAARRAIRRGWHLDKTERSVAGMSETAQSICSRHAHWHFLRQRVHGVAGASRVLRDYCPLPQWQNHSRKEGRATHRWSELDITLEGQITPRYQENKSKRSLEANIVEDMKDLPQYEQGGVRPRSVYRNEGTQHFTERGKNRPGKHIPVGNHQVDQDPHLDRFRGNNCAPTAYSPGTGPVAIKTHHLQSTAVGRVGSGSWDSPRDGTYNCGAEWESCRGSEISGRIYRSPNVPWVFQLSDSDWTDCYGTELNGDEILFLERIQGTLLHIVSLVWSSTSDTGTGRGSMTDTHPSPSYVYPAEVRTCDDRLFPETYKKKEKWVLLKMWLKDTNRIPLYFVQPSGVGKETGLTTPVT